MEILGGGGETPSPTPLSYTTLSNIYIPDREYYIAALKRSDGVVCPLTDGEDCIKLNGSEVEFYANLATVSAGSEYFKLDTVTCQNEVVPISQLDLSSYGPPVPFLFTINPESAPAEEFVEIILNGIDTFNNFEMPVDYEEGATFSLDFAD